MESTQVSHAAERDLPRARRLDAGALQLATIWSICATAASCISVPTIEICIVITWRRQTRVDARRLPTL